MCCDHADPAILKDETLNIMIAGRDTVRLLSPIHNHTIHLQYCRDRPLQLSPSPFIFSHSTPPC